MDYAANFAVVADNQLYIQLVEGVTPEALAGWVLATAVLGVLFAIWPAIRAARLNVLTAISYE